MNAITHHFLEDLAHRADLATTTAGGGRAYRFTATATPGVVLALVKAVDAVQGLCDSTTGDTPVSPHLLAQVLDEALAALATA